MTTYQVNSSSSPLPPLRQLLRPASILFVLSIFACSHAAVVLPVEVLQSTEDLNLMRIYKLNINKMVDKHLVDIRRWLTPLDPAPMKDIVYKMIVFKYSLTDGYMQNLPYAKRGGDCELTYKDRELDLEFNAFWDDLVFDYRYEYKSGIVKKTGDFHGQMFNLHMNVAYKYNFKTKEWSLTKFKFTDVGDLKISTEGSIWDKLGKVFIKIMTKLLNDVILQVIETKFREMLESNMSNENFLRLPNQYIFDISNSTELDLFKSIKYY